MERQMMRIGILGTGRIAARFIEELRYVETEMGEIQSCVYNPHTGSAEYFAKQHGILCYTDSLEELIGQVDAVYIATPHETHVSYAKTMLENGKHVLCEKPMALRGEDARLLYNLAKEKRLVLMEAVKTAYCPGFLGLQDLIQKGVIGTVYDVEACFTKIGSVAGREIWGEYGGSFLELGSYCLLPIVRLIGTQMQQAHVWSLESVTGCDSYTKILFGSGRCTATVKTGLGVKSDGELMIAGEKGYIHIPSPWWMTRKIEVHHENPNQIEVYEYPFEGGGLRYEMVAFLERIQEVRREKKQTDGFTIDALQNECLTEEESVWMADQMEQFLRQQSCKRSRTKVLCRKDEKKNAKKTKNRPAIWAHRGCSMAYPENTLLSFEKAAQIPGITGIELDVQLTKDGELLVIHDERLERTSTGKGFVKDFTLEELQEYLITPSGADAPYEFEGRHLNIPTLESVFRLLKPYCEKTGLQINIELKNSIVPYEGMEEKLLAMVDAFHMNAYIVYSSFNHASMGRLRHLRPDARTGLLSGDMMLAMENLQKYQADALHPCNTGLAINGETVQWLIENKIPVRVWNGQEPLFGQERPLGNCDLEKYVLLGATDLFTNVPERYL